MPRRYRSVTGMQLHAHLNFHGIGEPLGPIPPAEEKYWISRDLFREVLDLARGREDVSLSFDDGNRSDVDIALPELESRGLSAAFFVCAGRIGMAEYLGEADIRLLVKRGMSVGSHGWSHVPWRGLDKSERQREWDDATMVLSRVAGVPITTAACPFGEYDAPAIRGLRRAGIERIFTSDRAWASTNWRFVPRFTLTNEQRLSDVATMLAAPGPMRRARDFCRITAKRMRGALDLG